jgi:uncharacterized protein YndB with AHSA1/START domain
MAGKSKPNEINLTRVYDAPVKMVWDAWTDPAQVAKWWGPRGFTITSHSKDLKPGGTWIYTMHGPDGVDYPNKHTYLEVKEHSLMVYDHGANPNDDSPPLFRVTVRFEELQGKTRLEMTMALATAEAATETKKFIRKAGGNTTWDRLAEFLTERYQKKDIFVINRSFDAPIETLYKMWADPKHLARWLPPTGFTMEFIRAEIRPGGTSFYSMSNGAGMKMYGRVSYQELTPPRRLVYTQQFCDEHEKVTRHPMSPLWPETMLTRIDLEAEGPDQTRLTVTWEVHGSAKPEEMDVFRKARAGMSQGWTGSLDKLEDALLQNA